jgi:hypothetical protein
LSLRRPFRQRRWRQAGERPRSGTGGRPFHSPEDAPSSAEGWTGRLAVQAQDPFPILRRERRRLDGRTCASGSAPVAQSYGHRFLAQMTFQQRQPRAEGARARMRMVDQLPGTVREFENTFIDRAGAQDLRRRIPRGKRAGGRWRRSPRVRSV